MDPISPGTLVDNCYQIQRLLGLGGFGRTYLSLNTKRFNEPCVLKEFVPPTSDAALLEKSTDFFRREAETLYRLEHPQIPRFLASFEEQGRLFLVSEFVNGKTYQDLLNDRLQLQQTFQEWEIRQWLRSMLNVLAYIHSQNIVHRDIAPDNIMLPTGKNEPVLIDFGVVKEAFDGSFARGSRISGSSIVGKMGYASPEQIRAGQCSPASDLYSLAATAIVLLTGRQPDELIDTYELAWRWESYVQISPEFTEILNQMLADRPKDRYSSALEVITVLEQLQTGSQPIGFQPISSQSISSQPIGSQPIGSQPIGSQSIGSQSIGSQPIGSQSIGSQSISSQSIGSQSIISQPISSQPIGSQSIISQPISSQPIGSQSISSQPISSQSISSQPIGSQPISSQSIISQPIGSQPIGSQSIISQPIISQPISSQASTLLEKPDPSSLSREAISQDLDSGALELPAEPTTGATTTPADANPQIFEQLLQLGAEKFDGAVEVYSDFSTWTLFYCLGRFAWGTNSYGANRQFCRLLKSYGEMPSQPLDLNKISLADPVLYPIFLILSRRKTSLTPEKALTLVEAIVTETLFNILQASQRYPLKLRINPEGGIEKTSILMASLMRPEPILDSVVQTWEQWLQSGLGQISPDEAPRIQQLESLRQKVNANTYATLQKVIDGQRTLREIAVIMRQKPLPVAVSLLPYLS